MSKLSAYNSSHYTKRGTKMLLDNLSKNVYRYIRRYKLLYGYAPSEEEIASYVKKTRKTVHKVIEQLVKKGFLIRIAGRKRNLQLTDNKITGIEFPILGTISAGNPVETLKTNQVLELSHVLLGPNRFVLHVVGNSMSGDNIFDGDFIICERRDNAGDGDIVMALVNDSEVTLKRIKKNNDKTVSLIPSNPELSPMIYPENKVKIQGVYLGLVRFNNSVTKQNDCSEYVLNTDVV